MADIFARTRLIEGTTADWTLNNLILGDGEIGIERNVNGIIARVGNGVLPFLSCPPIYQNVPYTPPGGAATTLSEFIDSQNIDSISRLVSGQYNVDAVRVISFYGDWRATAAGPKSNIYLHFDGTTGGVPTVNTTPAIITALKNGNKLVSADGRGWAISRGQEITPFTYGAVGDGVTDDISSLEAFSAQNEDLLMFPAGWTTVSGVRPAFAISRPWDIGVGNTTRFPSYPLVSIRGPQAATPMVTIIAMPNFSGFSIVRNWREAWYVGAESRDGPPATLAAYQGYLSRYVNIHNVAFQVAQPQINKITAVDLCAVHERSQLSNLVFRNQALAAAQPLRIQTTVGSEISMNGFKVRDVTVVGAGWDREWYINGAGSDVDIDTWVSASTVHGLSPYYTRNIDMTIRNLHSEAYCAGQPTFDSLGTQFSIHQSFLAILNGQGDVFRNTNPSGPSGFSRCGTSLKDVAIYPQGGVWSSVANRAAINLYNDTSQAAIFNVVIPLQLPSKPGAYPAMIYSMSQSEISLTDGSGGFFKQQLRPTNRLTLTINSATPSAFGSDQFITANTLPTIISGFTGLTDGRNFTVIVNDANTTFDFSSSSLRGNVHVDYVPSVGDALFFQVIGAGVYSYLVGIAKI